MANSSKQSIRLEEISKDEYCNLMDMWRIDPLYPYAYTGYFNIVDPLVFNSYSEAVRICRKKEFMHSVRFFCDGKWEGAMKWELSEDMIDRIEAVCSSDRQKRNHFEIKLCAGPYDASNAIEMCGKVRFAELDGKIVTYELEIPRALRSGFRLSAVYDMNRCLLDKNAYLYGWNMCNSHEFGMPIEDIPEF